MPRLSWPGFAIVARIFDERLGRPLRPLAASDFTEAAVAEVLAQKLGPLAWHHAGSVAERPVARRLAQAYLLGRRSAERHDALLREVTEALDGARFLVLKGSPAARWLYGDPGLRPSVDLDILVEPREIARVGRALAARGFRAGIPPHGQYARTWFDEDRRGVDVHVEPWLSAIDGRRLLERAVRDPATGARVPSPEDQTALLAAHHVHDHGMCLLNLLDVLLALRRAGRPSEVEPLLRLIERDAACWLSIGRPGRVEAKWTPLDRFWAGTAPPDRRKAAVGTVLGPYVEGCLRPRRALSILAATLWPAAPSSRWRDRGGWRLKRIGAFVLRLGGLLRRGPAQ